MGQMADDKEQIYVHSGDVKWMAPRRGLSRLRAPKEFLRKMSKCISVINVVFLNAICPILCMRLAMIISKVFNVFRLL